MSDTETITIILVDDDEGHTELVRRNLKRAGICNGIVCFSEGAGALDFLFRRGANGARPTEQRLLVLLDINMPGINGIEVLRQIKSHPDTRNVPVIMFTTTDDPKEIERCYQLGCNVYVTKPLQPHDFVEAVNRLGLMLTIVAVPRGEQTA